MFKKHVFEIKDRIDNIVNFSEEQLREQVLDEILTKKLDRSYNNYVERLTLKINYILSRNNYKVIKAINKMKSEQEKSKEENYEEIIDE